MDKKHMRCPRCSGQKTGYVMNGGNGFSLLNFGGKKVDCPMCLGKGEVKTREEAMKSNPDLADKITEVVESSTVKVKKGRPKRELNSEL